MDYMLGIRQLQEDFIRFVLPIVCITSSEDQTVFLSWRLLFINEEKKN